ncbi:MAG: EamA family transporter [Lachnospiraceae bacterium]|nr:EamA family transporter [Lachnospiraceae bacterium]
MKGKRQDRQAKRPIRGMLLTLLGGCLWGFSGTCGQYLMQRKGLVSDWLVPVRLTMAGILLLLLCYGRQGKDVFAVWKDPKDRLELLCFGIFGMSMCQYTYFTAIGASNAGTATVLQYIGPVLIVIYVSLKTLKLPTLREVLAIVLAVLGTFLLATHGKPGSMVLSKDALFWGLASAVALAVYTVEPGGLLKRHGALPVTGWGMLIGGIMLDLLFKPWQMAVRIDLQIAVGMGAIILIGTIVAFSCYMEGIRLTGPKKGSLYASVEPVSATLFSVVWMHVAFGGWDLVGFGCILSTILLLAVEKA